MYTSNNNNIYKIIIIINYFCFIHVQPQQVILFNVTITSFFQPCPPGTPDFRTAQCEQYEKKPISGKFYKLESYISGWLT